MSDPACLILPFFKNILTFDDDLLTFFKEAKGTDESVSILTVYRLVLSPGDRRHFRGTAQLEDSEISGEWYWFLRDNSQAKFVPVA